LPVHSDYWVTRRNLNSVDYRNWISEND